ncbi:MAG: type II toxin-antitoxin system HicB family antitoxin, partial [Melioribacteraceae bacterium]|nr:type II toxin-antitoxin system HicB family antitoxin [Melioribacteraceae bacterium]
VKKYYINNYSYIIRNLFMREAIIYSGEDNYWVAECPSLPGCISQGKTKEEAIKNIKEAMNLYIETLEEDGLKIPVENFETLVVAV